jgi:hypothetical protein
MSNLDGIMRRSTFIMPTAVVDNSQGVAGIIFLNKNM